MKKTRFSNVPANSLDIHQIFLKLSRASALFSLAVSVSIASNQYVQDVKAITLETSSEESSPLSLADIVDSHHERLVQSYKVVDQTFTTVISTGKQAVEQVSSEINLPPITNALSAAISTKEPSFTLQSVPSSQLVSSEAQIEESKRKLVTEREHLRRRLAEIYGTPGEVTVTARNPSKDILITSQEKSLRNTTSELSVAVTAGEPMILSSSVISDFDKYERYDPSVSSGLVPQIGFEPPAELAQIVGIIQPMLLKSKGSDQTIHVFTQAEDLTASASSDVGTSMSTNSEVKKLALEVNQLNSKVREAESKATGYDSKSFKIVSGKIIQNLESGLGAIAKASTSGLAPELPTLIAKVYLPDGSDFGGSPNFDGSPKFVWPARGTLTSRFGWRWGRVHQGLDIAAPVGTPIWAAASGTIDFAGWNNGGYGNMIDVKHIDGTITRYAHLSAIYVKPGQPVNQSQVIAAMGNTGFSTGPHLHFELRPNGRSAVNPMNFLARAVSRG